MGFRIVKINNRCKLETQLDYLVCRADKETRILLNDISLLIIENQQVCITAALMSELMNHKVRVMFCDSKHNPQGELMPYSACYDTSAKIRQQFSWKKETQDLVWMWITKQKIGNQALVLEKKQATDAQNLLLGYARDVQPGDGTNREGLAAKSYFTALFGVDFDRRRDSDIRNTYLNYGYSLILSCVNKEIASFGYLTSIGIHHIGETNPFNLGCDFMEPIRPFVDRMIITNAVDEVNYKTQFMALLTSEVLCGGKNMIMENAIRSYVMGVLAALNEENLEGIQEITFKNEQL